MSTPYRELENSGRLLPFRKPSAGVNTGDEPIAWAKLLASPDASSHLKGMIEAAVLNAYVRTQLSMPAPLKDNPFDAVYIAELRPDRITASDRAAFSRQQSIADVSDTIRFADGWDD